MPTGYTYPVEEGTITTAKEFAANCARAFGAFIHQRDDNGDVLYYPTPPSEDSYYVKALAEAKEKLASWLNTTEEQKYAQWSESVESAAEYRDNSHADCAEKNAKYDAVLAQVEAIPYPPELKQFHDFMVQQLTDSKYGPYGWLDEPHEDYVTWCEAHEKRLLRDVRYYREEMNKERERYEERVAYIDLMRETYGFEVLRS